MKTCANNKTMSAAMYAYDALGRRIGKYDAAAMETTFYYYYDQWQILAEYTDDTTCRQWFTYGNYIDEVLSRNAHPYGLILAMQYYAHDHLYSPAALANASGATIWERYEYDAYGKVTITGRGADNLWYTADDVTLSASAYNNPFTFTGRQLDILDNGNLHHMHYRHRDYSPALGRFIQHDPLGITPAYEDLRQIAAFNQYRDGICIYQYVTSKPLVGLDPAGKALWYCTTDSDLGAGKHAYIYDDSFGDNLDSLLPGLGDGRGGQSCGMDGLSGSRIGNNPCKSPIPDGCRKGPGKGEPSPWEPDKKETDGKKTTCQRIGGTDDPTMSLCVMTACYDDINRWLLWLPWVHDCHNGVQDAFKKCGVEMVDDNGKKIPTDRL